MDIADQMERIYRDLALDEIPWNFKDPPELLVQFVESGQVQPCRAVDLGCGAGNYAVWLARRGFDVTGVDISPAAVERARHLAASKGVSCEFVVADLVGDLRGLDGPFDFAYDWDVLHHIFPPDRRRYAATVHGLLRPGGRYFSLCFSEEDPGSGGAGKFRTTSLGTTLYYSSEQELRELFAPLFTIDELSSVRVPAKRGWHVAVRALLAGK